MKNTIKSFITKGAISSSSKFLVSEIVSKIDFGKAKVIVELGVGDGVITSELLKHIGADTRLICFEIDERVAKKFSEKVHQKNLTLIVKDVVYLFRVLRKLNIQNADYVISSLPFSLMPDKKTNNILLQCKSLIGTNGVYIMYQYSGVKSKIIKSTFKNISRSFVLRNIPPAYVYTCNEHLDYKKSLEKINR